MKLLYQGPLWDGSTSVQRVDAFRRCPGLDVVALDSGAGPGRRLSFYSRVRWRLRWPVDELSENSKLLDAVRVHRPEVVVVDSSKVLRLATLRSLRTLGVSALVFYTPDNILASHNLSRTLRSTFQEWDVFFTTKTFNVEDLRLAGVRNPVLVGKAFDPALHRPLSQEDVGADYERFDLVFIGTWERERARAINALADAGHSIGVYGSNWPAQSLASGIELRPAVYHSSYVRAMHHGKLALNFLRQINSDRITQRTMEIAAMARPMVAEKTDEHDAHFEDGFEYCGFSSEADLVTKVRGLLTDSAQRQRMGVSARERCLRSGYSTDARAAEMVAAISGVSFR